MEEIKKLVCEFNKTIKTKYTGTRRGNCGKINIEIFFKKLITEGYLSCIINTTTKIDIYKYKEEKLYFKRVCICDDPCESTNKCPTLKKKEHCDGHHIILLSTNTDLIIDEQNDYVIDFTYKQLLFTWFEENQYKQSIDNMEDYLFLPYYEYNELYKYKKLDAFMIKNWEKNITNPCKFISTFLNYSCLSTDNISKYLNKYLKYKNKYLALKNLIKSNLYYYL